MLSLVNGLRRQLPARGAHWHLQRVGPPWQRSWQRHVAEEHETCEPLVGRRPTFAYPNVPKRKLGPLWNIVVMRCLTHIGLGRHTTPIRTEPLNAK